MLPRVLSPVTNPAGWMAAAGAVLAAAVTISNAINHHGLIDTTVIVAAVGAVAALFTRQIVTPVKDPKDPLGRPLVPADPPPPGPPPAVVSVGPNLPGPV